MQAIHAKALYDISSGFKNKDEKPIQQGLSSIQELAKKGYIPALMAVGNMFANGSIVRKTCQKRRKSLLHWRSKMFRRPRNLWQQ